MNSFYSYKHNNALIVSGSSAECCSKPSQVVLRGVSSKILCNVPSFRVGLGQMILLATHWKSSSNSHCY